MKKSPNYFSLENKNILVTGATGHFGKRISLGLATCNANVIVASTNISKAETLCEEIKSLTDTNPFPVEVDLKSNSSVKEMIQSSIDQYNKLDVIVNNAAYGFTKKLHEMSESEWMIGIDGTINATFRCIREIIPHFIDNNQGNIINISSMYGIVSPNPANYGDSGLFSPPAYGVGKAGLLQLTRYIAAHYSKYQIRCNSITPGAFPTPEIQKQNPWFIENLEKNIPIGRIGNPDEMVGPTIFLCSDASSYVNGHNLIVDGGWTIW